MNVLLFDHSVHKIQELKFLQARDETREKIALKLLQLFKLSIISAIGLTVGIVLVKLIILIILFVVPKSEQGKDFYQKIDLQEFMAPVKDIATLVLTAEAGLVGSALGFYFGKGKSGTMK